MKQEPFSLIINPMPDTKHCIMYWKPLPTNTRLLKADPKKKKAKAKEKEKEKKKKGFDRLNGACCLFNVRWDHFVGTEARGETLN